MAYRVSTLNKCLKVAATMDPKRYLSIDGAKLGEIIRILLPDSQGQPANVCAELVKIGRTYKWDIPLMSPETETGFLLWLVMEVAKT